MPKSPFPSRPRRASRARAQLKDCSIPNDCPTADGKHLPAREPAETNDRIRHEFLDAYSDINRRHAALLEARSRKQGGPAVRARRERAALQAIEKALRRRDELEDHYAPFGVIAEPVMAKGFAVDVKFTFGNVDAAGRRRSRQVESSAFLSITLPARVRIESLTFPSESRSKPAPGRS